MSSSRNSSPGPGESPRDGGRQLGLFDAVCTMIGIIERPLQAHPRGKRSDAACTQHLWKQVRYQLGSAAAHEDAPIGR